MQRPDLPNANGESRDPGNPTTGNPDVTEPRVVGELERTQIRDVVQQLESRTGPIPASEIVAAFAVLTIFAAVPASVLLAIVFEVYDITKDVQRCRKNDTGANDKYGTFNCFPYTRVTSGVFASVAIALVAHHVGSRHTVPSQGSLQTSEHVRSESQSVPLVQDSYPSVHQSARTDRGHPDGIELDHTVASTVPGSTVPTNRSAGDSGAEGSGVELHELNPTASAHVTSGSVSLNPFDDPPPPYLSDN